MFINPLKKIDLARAKRSSNKLKQIQDQGKVMNNRIKIMLIVVAIIFATIGVRLVQIQIIKNDEYKNKLELAMTSNQTFSSPRGTIYDRNGNILVQSVSSLTISYYPVSDITSKKEWEMAENLVDELGLKPTSITERQLKDMYMLYMRQMENDNLEGLLTNKDLKELNSIEDATKKSAKKEDLIRSHIDISGYDERQKAIYEVRMNMEYGQSNQYKVIAEDVTTQQFSYLSENSSRFPGFKCTFDWKRVISDNAKDITGILGKVSTNTQGVPSEEKLTYLGKDYFLNDRVGISGIEKQYEDYLAGEKKQYNIKTDESGNTYMEETSSGKNGYDLELTLDIDFQNKMDKVLQKKLEDAKNNQFRKYFNEVFFVAMNPNTGEIYAMSGASKNDKGEITSYPAGAYQSQSQVGSAVKIATLYMGLNEGVISPNEIIVDAPIKLKGTPQKASYHNYGPINDIKAIAVSSNVYMWHIAMRLAGTDYVEDGPLYVKEGTFQKIRNYYNMFGLGTKTGIDLPNESVGSIGSDLESGNILDFVIGQYDTYTTIQLAQYCAMIANGGKRVQPHLLKTVSEVNNKNTIIYEYPIKVLNTLIDDRFDFLERAVEGMKGCVSEGLCGNLGDKFASKTGTAENRIYIDGVGIDTTNTSQIGFAPVDNPKVVFACSAPNSNNGFGGNLQNNVCSEILEEASKEFFKN